MGEPWSSLAVDAGLGTIVAVGSEIWPRPPEKVLGMRAELLERSPATVAALVRALGCAAEWAADASNRAELARLLAQPRYVGAPASMLLAALNGELVMEPGGAPQRREGFLLLDREAVRLRAEDAAMLFERMQRCGQVSANAIVDALASYCTDVQDAVARGGANDVHAGRG